MRAEQGNREAIKQGGMDMAEKIVDAKRGITIKFLSDEQASKIEKTKLVPAYRVRHGQRRFVLWAERSKRLRGAVEIRIVGDNAGGSELEIIYSKSDA
jgi:hypothetical protein